MMCWVDVHCQGCCQAPKIGSTTKSHNHNGQAVRKSTIGLLDGLRS